MCELFTYDIARQVCDFTNEPWLLLLTLGGLSVAFSVLAVRYIDRWGIIISYLLSLLSPFLMYSYMEGAGDPFWFADFDKFNWLFATLGAIFSFALMYVLFSISIGLLKNITSIFSDTIFSILAVFLGLLWLKCALSAVVMFIEYHPILAMLILIGCIPSTRTPAIYVDGEGEVTGHGYHGGDRFHGDNGRDYFYDGRKWWPW